MALHQHVENTIHFLRYREVLPHIRPCDDLVDLGCGAGYRFLRRARHLAKRLSGIDAVVDETVDGNISVRRGDITERLPFRDATTDQVTILAVIEHVHEPAPVLRECNRILRPGGRLVVTTPSQRGIHVHDAMRRLGLVRDVEEDEHQDFSMSTKVLEDWLKTAGFEVEAAYAFELGMNLLAIGRKP
jgi:SAM-dependent methyltransferase